MQDLFCSAYGAGEGSSAINASEAKVKSARIRGATTEGTVGEVELSLSHSWLEEEVPRHTIAAVEACYHLGLEAVISATAKKSYYFSADLQASASAACSSSPAPDYFFQYDLE
jgi:hypothetical protein